MLAFLGLGSNLGDRAALLRAALDRLRNDDQITVEAVSPIYETEAHILHGQDTAPDFLNTAVKVATDYTPRALLNRCLEIERSLGRTRGRGRWLPRTIDIDILLIDGTTYADSELTVPHPRLHERKFALRPLADIAPEQLVPAPHNATVRALLAACADDSVLVRFSSPPSSEPLMTSHVE